MAASFTDRDLLYGLLAVQMGLVDRDALVAAVREKTSATDKTLGEILLQRDALTPQTKELVDALVEQHLALNENNAARSLATLSSVGSLGEELQTLGVAEVDASLAHLPAAATRVPESTRTDSPITNKDFTSGAERFRVVRMHAKGGIGQVSVAVDDELSREVALKELQPRYADDPGSRNRFVLEAEVTGGLEHPGVVPVYGLGHYADGRPFYAMRFIRGDSLQDATETFHRTMRRDLEQVGYELELRKLLRRFIDVCDALEYAHSRGVLHRDLKPGNIMLGRYGETLVVDWGLAKVGTEKTETEARVSESTLQPASADDSAPTKMGSTIGTPGYMSPEQAAGNIDQLGATSDVYSLGATLYHVLTGQPPFAGADVGVILSAVQSGAFEKPREVNPRIAKSLEAICLKAMAQRPHDRYGSARALAEDIERHLADEPTLARPDSTLQRIQRWTRRHRGVTFAAAAGLLLVAAVSAVAFFAVSAERDEARTQRDRAVVSEQQAKQSAEEAEAARALAEQQEKRAERVAYNSTLSEAGRLLGSDPMMARSLLENEDRCPPALRDFLWHAMHLQTVREERSLTLERPNTLPLCFSPSGNLLALGGTTNEVELRDARTGKLVEVLQTGLDQADELHFAADGSRLAVVHRQEGTNEDKAAFVDIVSLEVWDLTSKRLQVAQQYKLPFSSEITVTESGFFSHAVISESEYAQIQPQYLRDTQIPTTDYGERLSRWYRWTALDLESGEETTRYFRPDDRTRVLGNFDVGPPVLACTCQNEAGSFYWIYHIDSDQSKFVPLGTDELDTEYFPLAADDSEASCFGLKVSNMFDGVESLLDVESALFTTEVAYRTYDLERSTVKRDVPLGRFQTGMFIEFQRDRFFAIDQQRKRMAMLLDRRPLIQVAELDNPEWIYRIPAHRGDVVNLQFAPDGRRLASVGLDQTLRFWNLEEICTDREVTSPTVERVGRLILAPEDDQIILLALGPKPPEFDPNTGEPMVYSTDDPPEKQAPYFQLQQLKLSDGAAQGTQNFVNPPLRNLTQKSGFAGAIGAINEIVVNSLAGMFSYHPVESLMTDVLVSPDGKRLVLATFDRLLEFDVESGTGDELWGPHYPDFDQRRELTGITVSHDLKYFAAMYPSEQKVEVRDLATRDLVREVPIARGKAVFVEFVPQSQQLAVFSDYKTADNKQDLCMMEIWDVQSGSSTERNVPAVGVEGYFEFSQDGKRLVVYQDLNRQALVLDATTGEELSRVNLARNEPMGMLADSELLMLRTADGGLQFWDTVLDQYRTEWKIFSDEQVAEVVFSRDQKTLAVLGEGGGLRLIGADRLREDLADVRSLIRRKPDFSAEQPTEGSEGESTQSQPASEGFDPGSRPKIKILDEMPRFPRAIQQPAPWQDDENPAVPLPPAPAAPAPLPPAPVIDPSA